MPATEQLEVNGRRISVTNLNKILYPGGRFTKAKVIDYYVNVSEYLLPHLQDRPVTLKRFPNGIYAEFFYEKDAPSFTPEWVKTFPVPRRETPGPPIRYILINDLTTLVWLANLANLEIHPFLHRVPKIDQPTWLVFDLDPGEGADVLTCARVALMLREILRQLKLESFVKVSGSKGLQVYVPLNTPVTYEQTRPFAKAIADLMAEREPKLIVSKMPKVFRAKKVFIDWSQNDDYKTTVGVYSLRAKAHRPYVSMPVEWGQLKHALDKENPDELYFTPEEALEELKERGDIFKVVLARKQKLPTDVADRGSPSHAKSAERTRAKRKGATIRASRQGGRRRFAIQQRGGRKHLLLEMKDRIRQWSIGEGLPRKKGERHLISAEADAAAASLEKIVRIKNSKSTADVGSYELIEGSHDGDFFRVYLSGMRNSGEWTLSRAGKRWQLAK
jgi:bifunctional non-homologous end joining protein LigD